MNLIYCNRENIPKFQSVECVRHCQLMLPLLQLGILCSKLVIISKIEMPMQYDKTETIVS